MTAGEFVPLGPPRMVDLRCIVCGREFSIPDHVAKRAARDAADGTVIRRDDPDWNLGRFSDGLIAGACDGHTPDEVRTAYVLTEWKLTEEGS